VSGAPDILTIDVEEWFHGHNYLAQVPPATWEQQECRVVANTRRLLALLADHGVTATFFVLGWTAERYPELIRRITAAGHEIGCHSYDHPLVFEMSADDFRRDTERALTALRAAGVHEVAGYRSPSFSMTPPVHHFLAILRELGFRYDCSLFPIRHPRYGQPEAPRHAFRLAAVDGDGDPEAALVVVPMTTWRWLGTNWPFAGGGYLRLLPRGAYAWLRRRALAQGVPNIVYLHPWELDDYRPAVGQSRWNRWRSQGGQKSVLRKLETILEQGEFSTLGAYVAQRRAQGDLPQRALPLC